MAEINLLKTPTASHNFMPAVLSIAVKLFAALVIGVVAYYGFLFFKVKSADKGIRETQEAINVAKSEALNMPGRQEFLTRQSQLKEFINLYQSHNYYSKLLPALANVTLKTSYFTSATVSNQGKLNLRVVVPSLEELDKFLQVFDRPEVVKDFYNIRLEGFSKIGVAGGTGYTFAIQADFNPGLLAP